MHYLICLPFAGASKFSYRDFEKLTQPSVNVITLELPGRGTRMSETLLKDIHHMVDDIFRQLPKEIFSSAYAIFGHSMGGLIAYLLAHKITRCDYPKPSHLFITGTEGPSSLSREREKKYLLPKEKFIEELKKYQGSPKEVLENKELLDFFLPTLLADFQATENFTYVPKPALDIPITIITGSDEPMEKDDILLWQKESNHTVEFMELPGNHFFIFKHSYRILDIISRKLSKPL